MGEAAPISYGRLERLAKGAAARFAAMGLRRGDRVLIVSENRPEWGIAYLGATCAGLVAVPLLVDFSDEQLANIAAHSGAALCASSERHAGRLKIEGLPRVAIEELSEPGAEADSWPEALPAPLPEDMAAIIYTSGTTGSSKGVCLSHRNLVANCRATRSVIRLGPRDRLLSILPLAHTYECTIGFLTPLMQGAFVSYFEKPPTPANLMRALASIRPSVMLSVPLVMEKIYRGTVRPQLERRALYAKPLGRALLSRIAGMKLKKSFGGRIRFFGIGGAALAPDVEAFLLAARFPYAIGYGLTETSPLIAGAAVGKTMLGSTGPALPGVEVRLAPVEGAPEGVGELEVRGPNVMMGYYRDPERIADAFSADGWLKTGDLCRMDARGRISVRGRVKTMILNASGENVYPEEIEALLNQEEIVGESLVFDREGRIEALVYLKPDIAETILAGIGQGLAEAEDKARALLEGLRKKVNARLAAFSRIGAIGLQREPFAKTPTQKIKRFLYPARARESEG